VSIKISSEIQRPGIRIPNLIGPYPDEQHRAAQNKKEQGEAMMMDELTLGPVGPLRHMGVVVARHSTQPLAPLSATAMPSICSRQRSVGEVGHKIAGRGGRLNKGKRASRRVDLTAIGRTHRRRRQQRTASIRGRIAWRNLVPALVSGLLCFLEACSRD